MKKTLLTTVILLFTITLSYGQQIEAQKVFGGYKYLQDGNYLTMKQLATAMESNANTIDLMKKAQSSNSIANVMGFIGGGLIGWPIGTAIGGGEAQWALAGAGAVLVAIAIPISNGAHKKAREAVDIYNSGISAVNSKNFQPTFKVIGNSTGIGLSMSF